MCKQDGYHAVIEMENEARHLHGQIWIKEGRARGEIVRSVKRICERTIEDWNTAQAKVLSQGVKIAYSDWYESYLENAEKKSGDKLNVVCENIPDKTEEFYASEEEQEKIRDSTNAVDKRYHKLAEDFKEWWKDDLNKKKYTRIYRENVALFLGDCMFVKKTIPVCADSRLSKQLCNALYLYITRDTGMAHFLTKNQMEEFVDRIVTGKLFHLVFR